LVLTVTFWSFIPVSVPGQGGTTSVIHTTQPEGSAPDRSPADTFPAREAET
jgi:hypothetical protein